MPSTLIIGAGISGLMAATELQNAGHTVTVVDKGRGVGGRMASRRLPVGDEMGRADHGAQYFTVKTERFASYVQGWLAAGVVREWSQGFYDSAGTPHINGQPRYVGVGGMTAVAKHLAQSLDVHTATRITQLDYVEGQFRAQSAENKTFTADQLMLTPPAEQTLALIDSGNIVLAAEPRTALASIQFDPCFAVMAVLEEPSAIPTPGGLWPTSREPISWLSDNQQKRVSTLPSVTIHAGPAFTRQHWDTPRDVVGMLLIEAARPYIGDARICTLQVQRWKYSIPTKLHPEAALFIDTPGPVVFAGDAFRGARVEGAALSGLAAAAKLK